MEAVVHDPPRAAHREGIVEAYSHEPMVRLKYDLHALFGLISDLGRVRPVGPAEVRGWRHGPSLAPAQAYLPRAERCVQAFGLFGADCYAPSPHARCVVTLRAARS